MQHIAIYSLPNSGKCLDVIRVRKQIGHEHDVLIRLAAQPLSWPKDTSSLELSLTPLHAKLFQQAASCLTGPVRTIPLADSHSEGQRCYMVKPTKSMATMDAGPKVGGHLHD